MLVASMNRSARAGSSSSVAARGAMKNIDGIAGEIASDATP